MKLAMQLAAGAAIMVLTIFVVGIIALTVLLWVYA